VIQFNATVGYGTVSDSGAADYDGFVASSEADGEYVSHLLCFFIITIINKYLEAGLTASTSVQHIHYKYESQQKLY